MRKNQLLLPSIGSILIAAALLSLGLAGPVAFNGATQERESDVTPVAKDDAALEARIQKRIQRNPTLRQRDIRVQVGKAVVTLTGHVRSNAEKLRAERIARIPGVTKVTNHLEVQPATSTAGRRSGDGGARENDSDQPLTDRWINTKIKAKLIPEDALDGSNIDVETQDGIVTLTGSVLSGAGRARAVAIAKQTDGVRSVTNNLVVGKKKTDPD